MIVELTPQALSSALGVIGFSAPPLALAVSLVLLALYRRAVLRGMATRAAPGSIAEGSTAEIASAPSARDAAVPRADPALPETLLGGRRRAVIGLCAAALAYALIVAGAAVVAMESLRSPFGFGLVAWAAAWPLVPALWIVAPSGPRAALVAFAAYLVPLLVIAAADVLAPAAATGPDGPAAAIRAAWSPPELVRAWLAIDAVPTLLLLLVLNRFTRAIGPLVLAVVTLLISSCIVAYFAMFSVAGFAAAERITSSRAGVVLLLGAATLAAVAVGAFIGVIVLRRLRASYLAKRANDRSITVDGLWLVFAAYHGMLFALAGLPWVAVGVVGFLAQRAVLRRFPLAPTSPRAGPHGLVFLRVFSLGRRTEKLFDALSRYWRQCGSVQLIMGPDLARSTVQPHQMLDFVSGRLSRHFVTDAESLRQRIDGCDRAPDRDGLYRVNPLFCHADTWQAALAALVAQGDRVLMDLRSFGAAHAGCSVELHHLVHRVPLARCTWVVDRGTDADFLARTLREAWATMPADSPNAGSSPATAPILPVEGRWRGIGPVLARLASGA